MSTLPINVEKRISGTCLYPGCSDPASADCDFCAPHDAKLKGYKRTSARKRRQALADQGVCIVEGCGRRVGKRRRSRKQGGGIQQRRCARCNKTKLAAERAAREKHGVEHVASGVEKSSDDERWRVDPGTNWMRFRGKGRRGRLTREEQAAEDKRDLGFAIGYIGQTVRGIDVLVAEEPTLSKMQRWDGRRELAALAGAAERICRDFRRRYGLEDVPEPPDVFDQSDANLDT